MSPSDRSRSRTEAAAAEQGSEGETKACGHDIVRMGHRVYISLTDTHELHSLTYDDRMLRFEAMSVIALSRIAARPTSINRRKSFWT